MNRPRIRISYEVITPESAENGDVEERGWIDEEGTEHSVESAVELLTREHYVSPSSSAFHPGVWYSDADSDVDYRTGAETHSSYHLAGFSEQEERAIFAAVTKKRGAA
jgi:hypothetical protein